MTFNLCELTSYDIDSNEYKYWYEKEKEGPTANLSPGIRKLHMTQWLYLPTPLVSSCHYLWSNIVVLS